MVATRIIPCLLLQDMGLVKTVKFKKPTYIGDPVNAVKIFNEKEVDELIFLDISASKKNNPPNYSLIKELAAECFMPFAYGGGIKELDQIGKVLKIGVEKVILNKAAIDNKNFVHNATRLFGSSTIIVAIDIKTDFFGNYRVYDHTKKKLTDLKLLEYVQKLADAGAGEIFVNNVDRDGTFKGFDISIIKKIVDLVSIPIIACGGASSLEDFRSVVKDGGASAVAAGSYFVFQKPHRAVLISYPDQQVLHNLFSPL